MYGNSYYYFNFSYCAFRYVLHPPSYYVCSFSLFPSLLQIIYMTSLSGFPLDLPGQLFTICSFSCVMACLAVSFLHALDVFLGVMQCSVVCLCGFAWLLGTLYFMCVFIVWCVNSGRVYDVCTGHLCRCMRYFFHMRFLSYFSANIGVVLTCPACYIHIMMPCGRGFTIYLNMTAVVASLNKYT